MELNTINSLVQKVVAENSETSSFT